MTDLSSKIDTSNGISCEHFKLAKEYLNTFISELENNNKVINTLKTEIENKNLIIQEKEYEIDNFNKVSIIYSLNKQITEKDNIIKKLEYQLENTKKKLTQLQQDIKLSSVSELNKTNNKLNITDNIPIHENQQNDIVEQLQNDTDNIADVQIQNNKIEENSIKNSSEIKKKKRKKIKKKFI